MAGDRFTGNWLDLDIAHRADALLDRVTEVCTMSETANKVMALTRAGETNLLSVTDALMKDPALASQLLKLANSPLYGHTRQVQDLRRAVLVVGMQELHNLTAAMSLMAAFTTRNTLFDELRASSVLSAALARLLASDFHVDEATAYLSGLLCEIGAMACTAVDADGYGQIWHESKGEYVERAAREESRYGTRSEVLGARLLLYNRLPSAVADGVRGTTEGASDLLARITTFARRAAPLITRAVAEEAEDLLKKSIPALAQTLGLTEVEVDADRLFRICAKAATTADLSLRGEMMLISQESTDQQAVPGDLTVNARESLVDASAIAAVVHMQGEGGAAGFRVSVTGSAPRRWVLPVAVGAVAIVAAVIGFVVYFSL